MKGKADKLLADRSLSALVVVCLLASSFAGILILSGLTPTEAAPGDLIVENGTYLIENIEQPIDGNIEVRNGGELIVRNGALIVISNNDPLLKHSITVLAGGKLTLEHGNVTTYLDQIKPWPFLNMYINGGEVEASAFSMLAFPGNISLTNGGKMVIRDTTIKALDGVKDYFGDNASVEDSFDDGPAITLSGSTFEMYDSAIKDLPEYGQLGQQAKDITLSGASTFLAVSSHIGIDFLSADNLETHNRMVLSDTSKAHFYGTSFEHYDGFPEDRSPAVVASGQSFVALPASKDGLDNTGQLLTSLYVSGDGVTYHVAPGQWMAIDTFDAGPGGITVDAAALVVRYKVDSGYNGVGEIQWSQNEGGAWLPTGIVPLASDLSFVDASYDLRAAGVTTTTTLNSLDVRFQNTATLAHVQFDSMSIVVTVGTEAYVYRWLDVTVGDEYGVPIGGAEVSAVFTGSTEYGGQPSFYFGTDGIQPLPPTQILDYMGVDETDFGVTGEDGVARIPYLTDLVSGSQAGNSLFVGSFMITGTAGTYSSTVGFSSDAYPAMDPADQNYTTTVKIEGVLVDSPDPSRWLVVPPSLTIGNMTFIHAGDVIVKASGVLMFYNAWFKLVQSYPNERAIYVDGPDGDAGVLIIEKSKMTSDLPINIMVKGYATLKVMNSTLSGVNIIALDNSKVIFYNSNTTGTITTRYDSHATLIVKDSVFTFAPVLSGYSLGEFTNTSAPKIIVENSAEARIYRWIHVTVLDGNDEPLPGVLVSTRYLVNQTDTPYWAISSTELDAFGVAKVNSLATVITSTSGPIGSFVGNYWVNASYLSYYAPEVAVSVEPYTEPLGKNATFITMRIDSVFPDLTNGTVRFLDPVTLDVVTEVREGDSVLVEADVANDGTSYAFNVMVEFFDDEDGDSAIDAGEKFGTAYILMIAPGGMETASVTWVASPPLGVWHRIAFVVDRLNYIPELNETTAVGWGLLYVKALPDVYISSIYTSDLYVEIGFTTLLMAAIQNTGAATAFTVTVTFVCDGTPLGTQVISQIASGSLVTASVFWTPTESKYYLIAVSVSLPPGVEELDPEDNERTKNIFVYNHPDLSLESISVDPEVSASGGQVVNVTARLYNVQSGGAPVFYPVVRLSVSWSDGSIASIETYLPITLWPNYGTDVKMSFIAPTLEAFTEATIQLEANPSRTLVEISYENNIQTADINFLDVRGDLSIIDDDIVVKRSTTVVQGEMFGRTVTVYVTVRNLGGTDIDSFDMVIGVRRPDAYESPLFSTTGLSVSSETGNNSLNVTYQWTIAITDAGNYSVYVRLDANNTIGEPNEENNFALIPFQILALAIDVYISTDFSEYDAGDIVIVGATIQYSSDSTPVKSLPNVVFWIFDPEADVVVTGSNSESTTTGSDGKISVWMRVPTDIDSGAYVIRAVVAGQTYDATAQITISAAGGEALFPLWVWILLIVAVVGVVAGFTVYTYVYGLGKLVECGSCGAFIPAASKRCPKCGVEFEVGTMKCSECGAWIPAEATECPTCGVKFVGETEAEADYMDRMRKQYDDTVVSKYRALAESELGRKYTDKAFEQWWRGQPGYIAFEDWLSKEEEKKKEGPIACPVCGTLNPKEATVCHKCGTVFAAARTGPPGKRPPSAGAPPEEYEEEAPVEARETQAPQAAPGAAPRMVIRRPIDRKVVPKKIIKTPVSGEESGESTENNEGQ